MDALTTYAVYFNPSDYPEKYVVRGYVVSKEFPDGNPIIVPEMVVDSLQECREEMILKRGLYHLNRNPDDDPCIVEVYL